MIDDVQRMYLNLKYLAFGFSIFLLASISPVDLKTKPKVKII